MRLFLKTAYLIILGIILASHLQALAATTGSDIQIWPRGEIPYEIEDNVPSHLKNTIQKAIDRINSLKIVKFADRFDSEPETLTVFTYKKGVCSSSLGWKQGTTSLIKVSEECTYGKVLHEIFHALGFLHEHANPLAPFTLNLNRLGTAWEDQYTYKSALALTAHDPHSIMHYHSFENSICSFLTDPKWTRLPINSLPHPSCRHPNWKNLSAENNNGVDCQIECPVFLHPMLGPVGGERDDLSVLDIEGLRKLYEHEIQP